MWFWCVSEMTELVLYLFQFYVLLTRLRVPQVEYHCFKHHTT
jgi:hypothetical protein